MSEYLKESSMTTSALPTGPSQPLVQPKRSRPTVVVAFVVALMVAVGGLAFAAGRVTASAGTASARNFSGFNRGGANGAGAAGAGGAAFASGGGFRSGQGFGANTGITVQGTVAKLSGDTLTLTTSDGQTLKVTVSGNTAYYRRDAATASDVAEGDSVQVQVRRGAGGRPSATAAPNPGAAGGAAGGAAAESVTLVSP